MRIFSDMDLVEQLGSGMKKILKHCSKEDFEISDHFISVKLSFNKNDEENNINDIEKEKNDEENNINDIEKEKNDEENNTNDIEKQILHLLIHDNNISTIELVKLINKSRSTIDRALKRLKERKLIVRVGSDRSGHWEIIK